MKLHIGCGEKFLPGYKHMDAISRPHLDYVGNAGDLAFLSDNSVSEIYACHILEHFKRNEIDAVLKEWNRVLMSGGGGVLRVAVPNFKSIVSEYLTNENLNSVLGLLYGGQNYDYNFHYQVFDFKRLSKLLEKARFCNIIEYDWKEFLPNDYDDYSRAYLPHMDFENGRLMSLNVLAVKK